MLDTGYWILDTGYWILDGKDLFPLKRGCCTTIQITKTVMPAIAGIQNEFLITYCFLWIPAFAGMTICTVY
jgi:hypothetical protein